MKRIFTFIICALCALTVSAQGWPENYGGVMLQGFYWDSFKETKWKTLEKQATELGHYFSLVWVPQSGNCGGGNSMGYNPLYYFNQQSTFGSETELREMIKSFKDNGIGTIADVVVNHRGNMSNWVDFPAETYNGETYQMVSTDICRNDDGGETLKWANNNGYKLSENNDTGEGWSGMRDLDHKSENVQRCVKAYLKYLIDDLGYAGFRYDMVKGFSASFVGNYNAYVNVPYSVGEHFGNADEARTWIDGTKVNGVRQSAAFDFQMHYRLSDAITQSNWAKLGTYQLVNSGSEYNRYAITFVENHDTQYRSSSEPGKCPINNYIEASNAYILALPGTPCIFLKHWLKYKTEIKKMIEVRKLVGVTNTSQHTTLKSSMKYMATETTGAEGKKLLSVVGSSPKDYTAPESYKKIIDGYGYIYYVSEDVDTSGWQAILDRIASEDVPEPEEPFEDRDVTIYVDANLPAGWTAGYANFWVWSDTNSSNLCTKQTWPGDKITAVKEVDGKNWIYSTYRVTKANHPINIVLSTGTGSPQTVNFNGIENTTFLEILTDKVSGKNMIKDVTAQHSTGITDIIMNNQTSNRNSIYTLGGQKADENNLQPGIYILNGKKFINAGGKSFLR